MMGIQETEHSQSGLNRKVRARRPQRLVRGTVGLEKKVMEEILEEPTKQRMLQLDERCEREL